MTQTSKKSAFIATGLMLFALFFGAGNLIYPPVLGQQAGQAVGAALAGFLLTGVGLPLAGVLAVAYTGSRDLQELAGRAGRAYGVFFAVALYLAIGPLFAAPRTATVSFDIGIRPFLGGGEHKGLLAAFAAAFFALTYWLSISPGKLVDRVGKVLTPALLVSIAVLVGYAAAKPMAALQMPAADYAANPVVKGLIEGYGTMDALASLVFAIIVIDAVRGMGFAKKEEVLYLTSRAGFVAAAFLALVYAFVAYMGAASVGAIGIQENGAVVLAKSAQYYFGTAGNVLLAVIVILACLSTSVGLITACGEYFHRLAPRVSYRAWVTVFTLVSLELANVGLSGIIKLSVPALMLLYPLTVVLIALAFLDRFFGGRRIVYACTVAATLPVALIDGWRTAHGMFDGASDGLIMQIDAALKNILPLYADGLGWVAPAAVGLAVGLVLAAARRTGAVNRL